MVAQGKTNGEIAAALVVSKRTVEKHIAHILDKLGVTNRPQVVIWAVENGLVKPGHPSAESRQRAAGKVRTRIRARTDAPPVDICDNKGRIGVNTPAIRANIRKGATP